MSNVTAIGVRRTGGPAEFFAAGVFDELPLGTRLAKWDGVQWSRADAGVTGVVYSMIEWDDGQGTDLYALERYSADCPADSRVLRWDGTAWSPISDCLARVATSLSVVPGSETIPRGLYVTGRLAIDEADNVGVARWSGEQWHAVLSGVDREVEMLAFDPGSPLQASGLYAGGLFTRAQGSTFGHIARWDGAAWDSMQGGLVSEPLATSLLSDLTVHRTATGRNELLVSGRVLRSCGGPCRYSARYDGEQWIPFGTGVSSASIYDPPLVFDDGTGPSLYFSGSFCRNGECQDSGFFRWNEGDWRRLSDESGSIVVGDLGTGPTLLAFNCSSVRYWDSTEQQWQPIGERPAKSYECISSLATLSSPDGPVVALGGSFTVPDQGPLATTYGVAIIREDGVSVIETTGPRTEPGSVGAPVFAMVEFTPMPAAIAKGSAPRLLVVGGLFSHAGDELVPGLAQWDGEGWSGLVTNLTDPVRGWTGALAVHGEGDARVLYCAGLYLDSAGEYRLAKWDGSIWTPIRNPILTFDNPVVSLHSFTTGPGSPLVLGFSSGRVGFLRGNHVELLESTVSYTTGSNGPPFASGCINGFRRLYFSNCRLAGGIFTGGFAELSIPRLPGDTGFDDRVDLLDIAALITNWDQLATPSCSADLDQNGVLGFGDLGLVLEHWGSQCP